MTELKRIASFAVNHLILTKGMYVSRIDGDVISYDLRAAKPNGGEYLDNAAIHSLEHLFATYVRNSSYADQVIYFGPMGCRTGFYFLLRDTVSRAEALALVRAAFEFIRDFSGKVPGTDEIECGNFREHDLAGAKRIARDMLEVLADWTPEKMQYPA